MPGAFIKDDLSAILKVDEFGIAAVYDALTTVIGIFDAGYVQIPGVVEAGVDSVAPTFFCKEDDVPGVADGKTLLIDAVTYKVREIHRDGTGGVTLVLEKQGS